jgi:hypothetical protein
VAGFPIIKLTIQDQSRSFAIVPSAPNRLSWSRIELKNCYHDSHRILVFRLARLLKAENLLYPEQIGDPL